MVVLEMDLTGSFSEDSRKGKWLFSPLACPYKGIWHIFELIVMTTARWSSLEGKRCTYTYVVVVLDDDKLKLPEETWHTFISDSS